MGVYDPELVAMDEVRKATEKLSPDVFYRVLQWARTRHDAEARDKEKAEQDATDRALVIQEPAPIYAHVAAADPEMPF